MLASLLLGTALLVGPLCASAAFADPDSDAAPEVSDDGTVTDVAAPVDFASVDISAAPTDSPAPDAAQPTTRRIGPPTVVRPFTAAASGAASSTDVSLPVQLRPTGKLPPGPPSRLP